MFHEYLKTGSAPGEAERSKREIRWEAMRKEVERLTDALGKPLDEGIVDSVIALRLSGIRTTMSCEGHLGHGVQAPWVDFEPDGTAELYAREQKAETDKDWSSVDEISREINALVGKEWEKLFPLLNEFYLARDVPYHQRLVFARYGDSTRLISQGGEIQYGAKGDLARERLQAYQNEMNAFTRFLREKFVSGS